MKKSAVVKLTENLEKLKSLGIDASDIKRGDTIGTVAAKKGIKEKELRWIGLDPKRRIWSNMKVVQQAYRGKGTVKPPSNEEANKLRKLKPSLDIRKYNVRSGENGNIVCEYIVVSSTDMIEKIVEEVVDI